MTLRLATRRSPLALLQATGVAERLRAHGFDAQIVPMITHGDVATGPLSALGGQGVFAVEIQRAVLDGDADIAVHSAKDLPSVTPDGLLLASVPERRDPRDVLIGSTLADLAEGARVATGSPRRRALLLHQRPDLTIVELRGNMATRIGAAGRDGIDAVVAAAAALERLGEEQHIAEYLDPTWFTPQVGQGALALEVRTGDSVAATAVGLLHDASVGVAVRAERAFLAELGAGCSIPVAAHATVDGAVITLDAMMAAPSGTRIVRATQSGVDADELGARIARYLRDDCGGADLVG